MVTVILTDLTTTYILFADNTVRTGDMLVAAAVVTCFLSLPTSPYYCPLFKKTLCDLHGISTAYPTSSAPLQPNKNS